MTLTTKYSRKASSIDAHIGGVIKLRRKEMGLSQTDLGNFLGVSFQQVQKYERGKNRIGGGRLFNIANVLKMNVGDFYQGLESSEGPNAATKETTDLAIRLNGAALILTANAMNDRQLKSLLSVARAIAEPA